MTDSARHSEVHWLPFAYANSNTNVPTYLQLSLSDDWFNHESQLNLPKVFKNVCLCVRTSTGMEEFSDRVKAARFMAMDKNCCHDYTDARFAGSKWLDIIRSHQRRSELLTEPIAIKSNEQQQSIVLRTKKMVSEQTRSPPIHSADWNSFLNQLLQRFGKIALIRYENGVQV